MTPNPSESPITARNSSPVEREESASPAEPEHDSDDEVSGEDVPPEEAEEAFVDTAEGRAEHKQKLKDKLSALSTTHVHRSAQVRAYCPK